MSEKTAEQRHAEHDQMSKNLELLFQHDEERTDRLTKFIVEHSEKDNQFRIEMLNEIRSLERGISEKTSTDSALIVRQSRIEEDFKDIEIRQAELIKASERNLLIAEQHGKDISAAHKSIRGHEDRLDELEGTGGKVAISALKYIGTAAGGVGAALLIAYMTGVLHL